jgi:2-amino-4-hydroxy-6-hydroxymethyldihydropteridine diphosphokinase
MDNPGSNTGRQHLVYLALGANLGDRQGNLRRAIQSIGKFASVEEISSLYETTPVGYLDQPDFLNMAIQVTTPLEPIPLIRSLKQIEKQLGREPGFRNAPRPIDIDILFYDDLVLDSEKLSIPHPRMSERAFVLAPLAEIAPQAVHPVLGQTVTELLASLDQSGVKKLPPSNSILPV